MLWCELVFHPFPITCISVGMKRNDVTIIMEMEMLQVLCNSFLKFCVLPCKQFLFDVFATLLCAPGITEMVVN